MTVTYDRDFDVAIVGGGIGGSALACILARNGIRVVIIEGGGHPRFAIGESTTPDTTIGLRVLGARYDVPELSHLSSHSSTRRHVSTASGIKRNFSFVYHREGEKFQPTECTQFPTLAPPLGPDTHFLRQDVDAYLFQAALSYGATGLTYSPVTSADFDGDGVTLHTANSGDYRAKFLVDAGGMRSLLGSQLQLRMDPPPYRTRTRTIFSHFVGVEPFDRIAPSRRAHKMPSPFAQGTLHHLFKGGWAWVIPFDNHVHSTSRLCSVGINLDIDQYPQPADQSPEQEFWAHVSRFPDFQRQMSKAAAVRPYTASARNQFASRQVVGDRWCLLPHASDFIDPLFSTGLSATVMILNALGHRLISAVKEDDFAVDRFEFVETWTKKAFAYFDELVSNSYTAYDSFELWNAWHRVWMLVLTYSVANQLEAYYDFFRTNDPAAWTRLERAPFRGVQSIDNPVHTKLFRTAADAMQEYRDGSIDSGAACARIYDAIRISGLTPATMEITNPAVRSPAGTFTLVPITRLLLWGMYRSPKHVRGKYFSAGIREGNPLTRDYYRGELELNGAGIYQAGRDLLFSWNSDWRKVGGTPRP